MLKDTFQRVREASYQLAFASEQQTNDVLLRVADAIVEHTAEILDANKCDLSRMPKDNPLYDRLMLNEERLRGIAADMRNVALLPSPLGRVLKKRTLPNGLDLQRVSVPFGVIGVVYEARPNVTFDVFSLCLKAGSACILKGGRDADDTNRASVAIIHQVLEQMGINPAVLTLLPATHEATAELLHARGMVDLVIPRGGRRLIDFVRNEATVPVIETGAGVCHAYFDAAADLKKGTAIILNAKTRRVSVCNALDCLLIHESRLSDLPAICASLAEKQVRIYADQPSLEALRGSYPDEFLLPASDETYGTEFMAYAMAIRTVPTIFEAVMHIRRHGSGHSECIITEDELSADLFLRSVDAACVYHNAPTSFTDGAQFGLGAEIGISTQKLHARGPMALEEITTYKWIIRGNGQVRP